MTPPVPEPKAKGILLIHLNDYITKHHGAEGVEKVSALLGPAAAQMLRRPVAHEWYPHAQFLEVEEKVVAAFYGGDPKEARRFGEFNMDQAVNRVYRFLFRFLSPEILVEKSAKLWRTFMDQGEMKVENLGPRSTRVYVEGFKPAKTVWCHEMRGALEGGLMVCSVPPERRKVEEVQCCFRGDPRCSFTISW